MSAERTELGTELPINSLKVGLAFVKGEKVGAKALALAAENILSYAANQFLPNEIPVFTNQMAMSAGSQTNADIEAAFVAVLPDAEGTMKATTSALDWKTILRTLLPFLLGLL